MIPDLSVYLVTDTAQCAARGRTVVETVHAAVAGGVTAVQIREKDAGAREAVDLAVAVAQMLPTHVALLINDRVDVFLAARARGARVDGVHLGQEDLAPTDARRLIGTDAVIGLSASTPDQLTQAQASPAGVDYVGIGPVWPTLSKADPPPPLGLSALAALVAECRLPVVGIGGLAASDLRELRSMGLAGAAVVSALCASDQPEHAARRLAQAWEAAA